MKKDICAVENPVLYEQSHCGTKSLIEDLRTELSKSLKFVYEAKQTEYFTKANKLEFFENTIQSYGKTA